MRRRAFAATLSALPIFQPAQAAWLRQRVYAALGTDHAGLGFVVRGDIATPSTVRARSSYYDAVNATTPNLYSVGVGSGRRLTLPYGDGSFSIVITRYAFHHLVDPLSALQEITRVCAPGGRILVVDAYAPEDPGATSS